MRRGGIGLYCETTDARYVPAKASKWSPPSREQAWQTACSVFWVFVFCSVGGLVIETVYHLALYHELQNRAGTLFGPFSPLYGVGGLVIAIAAHFLRSAPKPAAFLAFAALGGAVEFCASWLMQSAFGILAWDYSGTWLSLDGRTNGFCMVMWGLLGMTCAYWAVPLLERKLLPWLRRIPAVATKLAMAAMALNLALTVVAFNCWYHRLDGDAPETATQTFFAEHFDDAYMADRFETMSLYPQDSKRS